MSSPSGADVARPPALVTPPRRRGGGLRRSPGKENIYTGLGRRPAPIQVTKSVEENSGFDSLQDLLEREGYKETRIVTPLAQVPPWALRDQPASTASPSLAAAAPCSAAQDAQAAPTLHRAKSVDALPPHTLRRRSTLWNASLAYRQSMHADDVPPVPPVPAKWASDKAGVAPSAPTPAVASISAAAPAAPAPALSASSFGFLAAPASPVLSCQDAVVQVHEGAPRTSRTLHRSKSEDLLHKALRARASTRDEATLACRCGRGPKYAHVAARWHMEHCPVRQHWAATAAEPVPPPPPHLTVTTPRGISPTVMLQLEGREYEPREFASGLSLFGVTPRNLARMKRATLDGLNTLFQSQERTKPKAAAPTRAHAQRSVRRSSSMPRARAAPSSRTSARAQGELRLRATPSSPIHTPLSTSVPDGSQASPFPTMTTSSGATLPWAPWKPAEKWASSTMPPSSTPSDAGTADMHVEPAEPLAQTPPVPTYPAPSVPVHAQYDDPDDSGNDSPLTRRTRHGMLRESGEAHDLQPQPLCAAGDVSDDPFRNDTSPPRPAPAIPPLFSVAPWTLPLTTRHDTSTMPQDAPDETYDHGTLAASVRHHNSCTLRGTPHRLRRKPSQGDLFESPRRVMPRASKESVAP